MVEVIKMTARIAALVILSAAIVVLFAAVATFTIGGGDITPILPYIGVAFTFVNHWTGGWGGVLVAAGFTLLSVELAIKVFKLATIAIRFVFRTSEG